jgi:hypothetical protein
VAEITPRTGRTDYIVANVLNSYGLANFNGGLPGISRFVDRHLGSFTPTAYFDGWLVLQSDHAHPALPRTRALVIDNPATGARLWAQYHAWALAAEAYGSRLLACREDVRCYSQVGASFRSANQRLEPTLGSIGEQLTPGCRQLLGPATTAVSTVSQILERTRRDGVAGNHAAVLVDERELEDVVRGDDVLGSLDRFATLCHVSA